MGMCKVEVSRDAVRASSPETVTFSGDLGYDDEPPPEFNDMSIAETRLRPIDILTIVLLLFHLLRYMSCIAKS